MLNAIVLFPGVTVIFASETLLSVVTALPVETLNLTLPGTITDAPLASAKTRNQNSQSVKSARTVDLRELVSAPRYRERSVSSTCWRSILIDHAVDKATFWHRCTTTRRYHTHTYAWATGCLRDC